MSETIFHQLFTVIEQRKRLRPAGSYTTKLLDGGAAAVGAKVMEEATEAVEAAAAADPSQRHAALVHEAADLIYHLWVMLAQGDVALAEVEAELRRRFGTSGLEEKAGRKGP